MDNYNEILLLAKKWFESTDYKNVLQDMILYGSGIMKIEKDNLYHQPVILGLEHGVVFTDPEDIKRW